MEWEQESDQIHCCQPVDWLRASVYAPGWFGKTQTRWRWDVQACEHHGEHYGDEDDEAAAKEKAEAAIAEMALELIEALIT